MSLTFDPTRTTVRNFFDTYVQQTTRHVYIKVNQVHSQQTAKGGPRIDRAATAATPTLFRSSSRTANLTVSGSGVVSGPADIAPVVCFFLWQSVYSRPNPLWQAGPNGFTDLRGLNLAYESPDPGTSATR
jgi:hypothetical protein